MNDVQSIADTMNIVQQAWIAESENAAMPVRAWSWTWAAIPYCLGGVASTDMCRWKIASKIQAGNPAPTQVETWELAWQAKAW